MDMRKVLCYVEFLFISNMWFATFIKVGGMQQGESQGGVRAELANTCARTHAQIHLLVTSGKKVPPQPPSLSQGDFLAHRQSLQKVRWHYWAQGLKTFFK